MVSCQLLREDPLPIANNHLPIVDSRLPIALSIDDGLLPITHNTPSKQSTPLTSL